MKAPKEHVQHVSLYNSRISFSRELPKVDSYHGLKQVNLLQMFTKCSSYSIDGSF